jgi:hypothetical protein
VSGWERVVGTATSSNESSPKTVTADCPTGKVVVGGGYVTTAVSGNLAEIAVVANWPSDSDTWTVTAAEDNDTNVGLWSVQAYAVCASM